MDPRNMNSAAAAAAAAYAAAAAAAAYADPISASMLAASGYPFPGNSGSSPHTAAGVTGISPNSGNLGGNASTSNLMPNSSMTPSMSTSGGAASAVSQPQSNHHAQHHHSHNHHQQSDSSSSSNSSTPGGNQQQARRKNATRETTATLKAWLYEHRKNPYPTKGEKIMLAIITKMSLNQVSTWFANARRRLKKENKVAFSPRNKGDDLDDDLDDSDLDEPGKSGDKSKSKSGKPGSTSSDNMNMDDLDDLDDMNDDDDENEENDERNNASISNNGDESTASAPKDHHSQFQSHLPGGIPAAHAHMLMMMQQQQQQNAGHPSHMPMHPGLMGLAPPTAPMFPTPPSDFQFMQKHHQPQQHPANPAMANYLANFFDPSKMMSFMLNPMLGGAFPNPANSPHHHQIKAPSLSSTPPSTPSSKSGISNSSKSSNTGSSKPKIWSLADVATNSTSTNNSNKASSNSSSFTPVSPISQPGKIQL